MGQLVDAIAARLPAGAVRLNSPVIGITPGFHLQTPDGTHDCSAVVIAAPAHAAAQMLASLQPEAAALCAQTAYVSTVSVALAWPQAAVKHPLAGSGFVVARATNQVRMTACTWVTSKFEHRAPAGHVLLRAYLGGVHDPGAVDLSDDDLIGISVRELSKILSIAGPPELARVFRWRNGGAQHDTAQAERVAAIQKRLSAHRGIYVAGSGFRAVGIPDCISDGRRTALAAVDRV
jgi:oxygen-dependent protoporphyrinogen oxidase